MPVVTGEAAGPSACHPGRRAGAHLTPRAAVAMSPGSGPGRHDGSGAGAAA